MEKLGINAIQLLAQLVNFGIILFVLKKFLYKPVLFMLDKRKQTIEDNARLQGELEKKLANLTDKEKELDKKAKSAAAKIADEARKEGEKSAQKILDKAEADAKLISEEARKKALAQLDKVRKEIEFKVEEKALVLANKIISQLLPGDVKARISQAQVKKLSQAKES